MVWADYDQYAVSNLEHAFRNLWFLPVVRYGLSSNVLGLGRDFLAVVDQGWVEIGHLPQWVVAVQWLQGLRRNVLPDLLMFRGVVVVILVLCSCQGGRLLRST